MTCYRPSDLAFTYPTEVDLAGLFNTNGITTGFQYIAPGSLANWAAVLTLVEDEGFFTGCYPMRYYTPAQATVLAGMTFSISGHSMDGVEYLMRTEGVADGNFTVNSVYHSPGEAPCDILQELSDHGYATGVPVVAIDSEPAMSDTGCNDGRLYETCCLEPWTTLVTPVIPTIDTDVTWTANAAIAFSHTFLCNVKIFAAFYMKTGGVTYGMRIKVDGVVVATYDPHSFVGPQTQNDFCYFTEFTLAASAVARAFTFEYINETGAAVPDSHIYMIAYHDTP